MRVLLTGANRGIGLELAKLLSSSQENEVHCLQRNTSPSLESLNVEIHTNFDFSSRSFVDQLSVLKGDFDLAIFNAGTGFVNEHELELDVIAEQIMVNSISQVGLAHKMRSQFKPGSKVVFISSIMGSTTQNNGGYYGYRASKATLNSLGKTLAEEFKEQGTAVFLFHPGYVRTEMTGGNGFIEAEESAKNILDDIKSLKLEQSGLFWHTTDKEEIPF